MKEKYGDKIKLLGTDTDSLIYEIETEDVYEDMKEKLHLFDFSEYPKSHPLFNEKNKKVVGKFKDETNSIPIEEYVGLRSKMYGFEFNEDEEIIDPKKSKKMKKKAKGIKNNTVEKEVNFEDYKRSLFGEKNEDIKQMCNFNSIQSINHSLYSTNISKIGLSSADSKRFLLDYINTLSYGHYKINKEELKVEEEMKKCNICDQTKTIGEFVAITKFLTNDFCKDCIGKHVCYHCNKVFKSDDTFRYGKPKCIDCYYSTMD
jgi:hypothetical protein